MEMACSKPTQSKAGMRLNEMIGVSYRTLLCGLQLEDTPPRQHARPVYSHAAMGLARDTRTVWFG
jgi:hypothetical protein